MDTPFCFTHHLFDECGITPEERISHYQKVEFDRKHPRGILKEESKLPEWMLLLKGLWNLNKP